METQGVLLEQQLKLFNFHLSIFNLLVFLRGKIPNRHAPKSHFRLYIAFVPRSICQRTD